MMITLPKLPTENKMCCSCGLCVAKCPRNAISMKLDDYGFLRPAVDATLCIGCHLCEAFCKKHEPAENHDILCYEGFAKEEAVRKESSSGGIAYVISRYVIRQGGVVYGVSSDEKLEAIYTRVEEESDLKLIQGSKYLQADASAVYKQIKQDLQQGFLVCFFGLPCQAQAVRLLYGNKYMNLYIIDIACHGVPSVYMFRAYMRDLELRYGAVTNFRFRDKSHGWRAYEMSVNGKCVPNKHNDFKTMFLSGFGLNAACYSCGYDVCNRTSDISLGDCWERPDKGAADYNGVSSIVIHSSKGMDLIRSISEDIHIEPLSSHIVCQNTGMRKRRHLAPQRNEDFILMLKKCSLSACKKKFYAWWGTERWGIKIGKTYFMLPRIVQYAFCKLKKWMLKN